MNEIIITKIKSKISEYRKLRNEIETLIKKVDCPNKDCWNCELELICGEFYTEV